MQLEKLKAHLQAPHTHILTPCIAGDLLRDNLLHSKLTMRVSWDTFRTYYPLMSLHSPVEFSEIVSSYIDGWRKNGWMPECRANNLPGWTQGGEIYNMGFIQSISYLI